MESDQGRDRVTSIWVGDDVVAYSAVCGPLGLDRDQKRGRRGSSGPPSSAIRVRSIARAKAAVQADWGTVAPLSTAPSILRTSDPWSLGV